MRRSTFSTSRKMPKQLILRRTTTYFYVSVAAIKIAGTKKKLSNQQIKALYFSRNIYLSKAEFFEEVFILKIDFLTSSPKLSLIDGVYRGRHSPRRRADGRRPWFSGTMIVLRLLSARI